MTIKETLFKSIAWVAGIAAIFVASAAYAYPGTFEGGAIAHGKGEAAEAALARAQANMQHALANNPKMRVSNVQIHDPQCVEYTESKQWDCQVRITYEVVQD